MQCPDDAAPQVGIDQSCTSNVAQQRFCCCYFLIDPKCINYYHLGNQSPNTTAGLLCYTLMPLNTALPE